MTRYGYLNNVAQRVRFVLLVGIERVPTWAASGYLSGYSVCFLKKAARQDL